MKSKDLPITSRTNKVKECVDFYTKYFQAVLAFDSGWNVVIQLENEADTPSLCLSFHDTIYIKIL